MRHGQKGYKLGRTHAHRKATLAALSTALIKHKRIRTTLTKAKALRTYVEPLITRSKDDTTHNRRQVFRYLQDKYAVTELFGEVSDKVGDRNGGYTRIVKLGQRGGDGAEMAIIELVDFNDSEPSGGGTRRSRRTRRGGGKGRRRGGAKKTQATEAAATTTVVETEAQTVAPDDEMEGVQTETVEESVADDVATPVEERTEDAPEGVDAEAVEAETAEPADEPEAVEEPVAEAEVETPEPEAAEEPVAEVEVETATQEPEAEVVTEQPEAAADVEAVPEEAEAATDEPEAEAATEQPEVAAEQADEATDEDKKEEE